MAATPVSNGCFVSPQLSPYPGNLQVFVIPWPHDKKAHCIHSRLGCNCKPSPAAARIPSTPIPIFSPHTLESRRSTSLPAEAILSQHQEEKCSVELPDLPYKGNSSLSVEHWGTLYTGPHESKYWNSLRKFPYPVGYTAVKTYKGSLFKQTIEEGASGPVFVVEEPGGKKSFSSKSPQKAWDVMVEGDGLNVHGARHFGFQCPGIIRALQSMMTLREGGKKVEVLDERESEFHSEVATEKVPELHDDFLDFMDDVRGPVVPRSDRDHGLSKVDMMFDEEDEDDDGNDVEDDDGDNSGDDEVEEEDEEEDDDLQDVEAHNVRDNHDHDLENDEIDEDEDGIEDEDEDENEDEDEEEDVNETSTLSYNVYPGKYRAPSHDDSLAFDDMVTPPRSHKRSSFNKFGKFDNVEEAVGVASNSVYYPSDNARPKVAGRVWRKGEGLPAHGIGHGKQQGLERSKSDYRSFSGEGTQARASTALSARSWDSTPLRRREENSKSSQMLLELLQKWNKMKRWNHEPGERSRGWPENKGLQQIQDDREQQQEFTWGIERNSALANKSATQGLVSEANSIPPKGMRSLRNYDAQEAAQNDVSLVGRGESVLDELRDSDDVDESTDYAISRLFETVGKKTSPSNSVKPQPRLQNLSKGPIPRMDSQSEKSWNNGFSRTSMEVLQHDSASNLLQTSPSSSGGGISLTEKLSDVGSESTQLVGRAAPVPEKKIEEIKLMEDVRKLVGSNRVQEALVAIKSAKTSGLVVEEDVYEALLGNVKLEAWQKHVVKDVQDWNSVLISAPCASGKSAAADCCLYRNFAEEKRALFVTPYEHLARVKLHQFENAFGHGNVGGMGTRAQKDHKLVVVSLEALAKMLQELNGPGGSEFRFFFEGMSLVVLDKFHTFSEAKFGTLWEEIFMLMDPKLKLIALTLPAKNEDQIVSWMNMNRGPCKLVSSSMELVPKHYLFCHGSGILPLFDAKGAQLNGALKGSNGGYGSSMTKEELEPFFLSGYDKPSLKYALSSLVDNAMLPAFVVLFSAKGCDDALQDASTALEEGLLSQSETARLEARLNEFGERHPELLKHLDQAYREALQKGIAACYESKLPAWQAFVLRLFQENLVKLLVVTESVLFQTEAMARTLVLPATCRVMKDGVTPIPAGQVLQLFGSVGRRGYDIEANIVFLKNFYHSPSEAAFLVQDHSFEISSSFRPSYSLVVNLMARHKLSKVKQLLGSTFRDFVYLNTHAKVKKLEFIDSKVLDCLDFKADLEVSLFQGLAEVNKQKLTDAAVFTRVDIRLTTHSASHNGNTLPGFLLAVVPDQQGQSFYLVFGADNNFRMVPAGTLDHVYTTEFPTLDVLHKQSTGQKLQPPGIPPKEGWTLDHGGSCGYIARGNTQTKQYVQLLTDHPVQVNVVKEGLHLRNEILSMEAQISSLIETRRSIHGEKQAANIKLLGSPDVVVNGAIQQLDESETWKEALRLLKVLEQVDALSVVEGHGAHVKLKPLGMLISRLHNVDNELWLALVLTSSYVKQLLPAEFAGIVAAMVAETEAESIFSVQRELLFKSTKAMKDAFCKLEVLRKQVAALQGSYMPPLHFGTTFGGLVYAWARGKPGTAGFSLEDAGNGELACKLRSVVMVLNLISKACSQVCVDISEQNDFSNLSRLAKRAEELLSRHLLEVDRSIL